MLKRLDSAYEVGRRRGSWWKWKVDPQSIDAVLTYSMQGHRPAAGLYTDHTFGLWQDGELVTFAKAYSGLTDVGDEGGGRLREEHTVQRFGPVRQVEPELVFEIAFEGIGASTRHKAAWPSAFPASPAGAGTRSPRTPTPSTTVRQAWSGHEQDTPELDAWFTAQGWAPLPFQRETGRTWPTDGTQQPAERRHWYGEDHAIWGGVVNGVAKPAKTGLKTSHSSCASLAGDRRQCPAHVRRVGLDWRVGLRTGDTPQSAPPRRRPCPSCSSPPREPARAAVLQGRRQTVRPAGLVRGR